MKLILLAAAIALFASSADAGCRDKSSHADCQWYLRNGWCKRDPIQAKEYCEVTCGLCGAPPKPDPNPNPNPNPNPGSCGKPQIQGQRVIAGVEAVRGSWPWQILMLRWNSAGCGGSIVGPRHVVTAAHCVEGLTDQPNIFKIRVGEHERYVSEGTEKEYQVEKIFIHPDYNYPSVINNDIAVLKLQTPIQFNKYVSPVCLPDNDVPVGTECYITGWGKVRHPGDMSIKLQQARMPVVSNRDCNAKNQPSIGVKVTDAMVCSGDGGNTRKSGCHGDSGGPFVCQINGRWELHGAVSHGSNTCDSTQSYSVYARVYKFKAWIKNVMSQ